MKKISLSLIIIATLLAVCLSACAIPDPNAPSGFYELTKLYDTSRRPTDFHLFVPKDWNAELGGYVVTATAPMGISVMAWEQPFDQVSLNAVIAERDSGRSVSLIYWEDYYLGRLTELFGAALSVVTTETITMTDKNRPAVRVIYHIDSETLTSEAQRFEVYIVCKNPAEPRSVHIIQLSVPLDNHSTKLQADFNKIAENFAFVGEVQSSSNQ